MKNQIKIRLGNENQPPMVVFIKGKNSHGHWICERINTGEIYFSSDENNFIDFDYKKFELLEAEWRVENAKNSLTRFEKNLAELKENQ